MARYDGTFVDRFLEPWNRHDVDGALALMTDDCVWLQHLSGFSDQECARWTPRHSGSTPRRFTVFT